MGEATPLAAAAELLTHVRPLRGVGVEDRELVERARAWIDGVIAGPRPNRPNVEVLPVVRQLIAIGESECGVALMEHQVSQVARDQAAVGPELTRTPFEVYGMAIRASSSGHVRRAYARRANEYFASIEPSLKWPDEVRQRALELDRLAREIPLPDADEGEPRSRRPRGSSSSVSAEPPVDSSLRGDELVDRIERGWTRFRNSEVREQMITRMLFDPAVIYRNYPEAFAPNTTASDLNRGYDSMQKPGLLSPSEVIDVLRELGVTMHRKPIHEIAQQAARRLNGHVEPPPRWRRALTRHMSRMVARFRSMLAGLTRSAPRLASGDIAPAPLPRLTSGSPHARARRAYVSFAQGALPEELLHAAEGIRALLEQVEQLDSTGTGEREAAALELERGLSNFAELLERYLAMPQHARTIIIDGSTPDQDVHRGIVEFERFGHRLLREIITARSRAVKVSARELEMRNDPYGEPGGGQGARDGH